MANDVANDEEQGEPQSWGIPRLISATGTGMFKGSTEVLHPSTIPKPRHTRRSEACAVSGRQGRSLFTCGTDFSLDVH